MPRDDQPGDRTPWQSVDSIVALAAVMLFLLPLTGCADERTGQPALSNLAVPMDGADRWDAEQAVHSTGAEAGNEKDPVITMTATPSGITANVSWEHPPDFNVAGYVLYYEKQAPESPYEEAGSDEPGSENSDATEPSWCSQGERQTVAIPSVTITGLEPNTSYVFAIRAFTENESESLCSNPIVVVTPPADA